MGWGMSWGVLEDSEKIYKITASRARARQGSGRARSDAAANDLSTRLNPPDVCNSMSSSLAVEVCGSCEYVARDFQKALSHLLIKILLESSENAANLFRFS
jgi:hypothetical protein